MWDSLVRSRALVLDEMSARKRIAGQAGDPEIFGLRQELARASAKLANLRFRGAGADDPEHYRQLLDAARRERTRVEQELANKSLAFRREQARARAGLPEVLEALPAAGVVGGTYAENYGRAISFYVHMYRATGAERFLVLAEGLATEAVDKLYVETEALDPSGERKIYGIFRGHPAKPYYESNAFVGVLLWALLELNDPDVPLRAAL